MDFRELTYITTIADCGSVTEAAKRLYISQPSLSYILAKVEEDLGVKLFDRKTSPLTLTYAGERYVATARTILSLSGNLRRELKDIGVGARGEIRIGIPTERAGYMLPKVLGKFHERYPEVQVRLVESRSSEILGELDKDKISFAVLPGGSGEFPIGLESRLIYRERVWLAAPERLLTQKMIRHAGKPADGEPGGQDSEDKKTGKRDARGKKAGGQVVCEKDPGTRECADLKEMKDLPFIIMKSGQYIRKKTEKIFRKAGFFPKNVMEVSSCVTAVELARTGMGVTIVPDRALDALGIPRVHADDAGSSPETAKAAGGLRILSCSRNEADQSWDVSAVYKKETYLGEPEQYLIKLMMETFGEIEKNI